MNRIGKGLIFQSLQSPNINYHALALCSLNAVEKDTILLDVFASVSPNTHSEHSPVFFVFYWKIEKCADALRLTLICLYLFLLKTGLVFLLK